MDKYRKKVKIRMIYLCVVIAISVILLILSFCKVIPSNNAFMGGFFSGFTAVTVVFLIRCINLLKDDEALKKSYIKEHDDREWQIVYKASRAAFVIGTFILATAIIISAYYNEMVFKTLMAVYFGMFALYMALMVYFRKVT